MAGDTRRVEVGPLHSAATSPPAAAGVPIDHTAEAPAVAALERRGFTASFVVDGDVLRLSGTERRYRPEFVSIRDYYRFEGTSDPDDMSVVYALETRDGVRGTLVDAFGVKADPAVAAMLDRMQMRRPGDRPAGRWHALVTLGLLGVLAVTALVVRRRRRAGHRAVRELEPGEGHQSTENKAVGLS
jgi:hypothetical protein